MVQHFLKSLAVVNLLLFLYLPSGCFPDFNCLGRLAKTVSLSLWFLIETIAGPVLVLRWRLIYRNALLWRLQTDGVVCSMTVSLSLQLTGKRPWNVARNLISFLELAEQITNKFIYCLHLFSTSWHVCFPPSQELTLHLFPPLSRLFWAIHHLLQIFVLSQVEGVSLWTFWRLVCAYNWYKPFGMPSLSPPQHMVVICRCWKAEGAGNPVEYACSLLVGGQMLIGQIR